MSTKKKAFDCVEMKRAAAARIYETLKGKSREERLAYWQARHQEAVAALEQARTTLRSKR